MMQTLPNLNPIVENSCAYSLSEVQSGFDALLLAQLSREALTRNKSLLFIVRDDMRLTALEQTMAFFAPDVECLPFPAWDCLPYDRVSPHGDIVAKRMETLATLSAGLMDKPRIILTTVNAALQRVAPKSMVKNAALSFTAGDTVDLEDLTVFLIHNGYVRASQVMEAGEFAVRGNLIDIFPSGYTEPTRLDFFGDDLESIRTFDPISQRTTGTLNSFSIKPVSEFTLTPDSIAHFKRRYINTFGPTQKEDGLYAAISAGARYQGAEHWLPLLHEHLETLFDYLGSFVGVLDYQADIAAAERFEAIADYYQARLEAKNAQSTNSLLSTPYNPLPPHSLYLDNVAWQKIITDKAFHQISPFKEAGTESVLYFNTHKGRDFGPERNNPNTNVYDALKAHIKDARKQNKRIVLAHFSLGSLERMSGILKEHAIKPLRQYDTWQEVLQSDEKTIATIVLPLEHGFTNDTLMIISEQDLLDDRLVRQSRRNKKADNFLTETNALTALDLVVHSNHGIGRFLKLETVTADGSAHDCLLIEYAGGDKLYVPVENIEVLSRYGAENSNAALDKLGGVAWQGRKAKLKKRIKDMADTLINMAAARALKRGEVLTPPEGMYDEFCARFPYSETDDQQRAIYDVIQDLGRGRPMDRLICGDVGFGKTEVALRAAFVAVMAGQQVAIVAPTTLLARQHYQTFKERFKGLPVKIGLISRLVGQKEIKATKQDMSSGQLDIVIGTHALLGKDINFSNLGLLVIDEEQHFGVVHKEKLKQLKSNIHVLTLTATPIPRTLQLSMSGIRDLSLIATPPIDRLAVRTFISPFDPVVIKEALMREHHRGGQSFYVCPRIADLHEMGEFLREYVPEIRFIVAHGQMAPKTIEDVMTAFYDGQYDVLLSTTIIESGIDIPTVNTMIIHRADMFGLSQLYQLRGRVGRSKTRAYAYLTVPTRQKISENAEKRLHVLQTLDTLGAGFTIASHDMDIRGAGNLLGDEQSGHVREVGVELYQQMLEEAVAKAKSSDGDSDLLDYEWSPQINLGATVMIPESYVPDLNQRMALYRRLAGLQTRQDVDDFAAELIDRFGPLPNAVKQLAAIMIIKSYCKTATISKLDAGPRGVTLAFKDNSFSNPAGLIEFISNSKATAKMRPDHTIVYQARMDKIETRLKTVANLTRTLANIAKVQQAN